MSTAHKLTLSEAVALKKLAEQRIKELEKYGEELAPGNYAFDCSLTVRGMLAKGAGTEVAPSFKPVDFLKPLLLVYAGTLNKTRPGSGQEWLNVLLATDGALGNVIRKGADEVMEMADPKLTATWDAAVKAAKDLYHASTQRVSRAGDTTVVGELAVTAKNVETPAHVQTTRPYESAIAEAATIAAAASTPSNKTPRALKPDSSYTPASGSDAALSTLEKVKKPKRGGK